MTELYNVSITGKCDLWLKEDEENPDNWIVMNKAQLEQWLHRAIDENEKNGGREIVGYDDVVWKRFS